jgi:hypothetical protein
MLIYILDDLGFNYHGGHVAILAADLDDAITAFKQMLENEWGPGDDWPYRNAVEKLADDGRDYTERNWDNPTDAYAPYLISDAEAYAVFREKLRARPWRVVNPQDAPAQVLAYHNGDC